MKRAFVFAVVLASGLMGGEASRLRGDDTEELLAIDRAMLAELDSRTAHHAAGHAKASSLLESTTSSSMTNNGGGEPTIAAAYSFGDSNFPYFGFPYNSWDMWSMPYMGNWALSPTGGAPNLYPAGGYIGANQATTTTTVINQQPAIVQAQNPAVVLGTNTGVKTFNPYDPTSYNGIHDAGLQWGLAPGAVNGALGTQFPALSPTATMTHFGETEAMPMSFVEGQAQAGTSTNAAESAVEKDVAAAKEYVAEEEAKARTSPVDVEEAEEQRKENAERERESGEQEEDQAEEDSA